MPGPRCPDCNRFVSLEMEEPEIEACDVDPGGELEITARLVKVCAECGTEIRECYLEITKTFSCPPWDSDDAPESTVDVEYDDFENTERYEGKGRYQKTFHGIEGSVTATFYFEHDREETVTIPITIDDGSEMASSFEDLN
jgi:hypothetical protein